MLEALATSNMSLELSLDLEASAMLDNTRRNTCTSKASQEASLISYTGSQYLFGKKKKIAYEHQFNTVLSIEDLRCLGGGKI